MTPLKCGYVPPTSFGYAPCRRNAGHPGPCAHEPLEAWEHMIADWPVSGVTAELAFLDERGAEGWQLVNAGDPVYSGGIVGRRYYFRRPK